MKRTFTTCTVLFLFAGTVAGVSWASPINAPGPHPFQTAVLPSLPWLRLSLPDFMDLGDSFLFPVVFGLTEVEVTKTSNDGGTTYTGLESVQFTGGQIIFDDEIGLLYSPCGIGTALVDIDGIKGTLTSPLLPVNDPDFDGTGTFNPAGSVFLIDQGQIAFYNATGLLATATPGFIYDFAATPMALTFANSTATIIDVPGTESINIAGFKAVGGEFEVDGPLLMQATLSDEETGCFVPEPSTFALAFCGMLVAGGVAVARRRKCVAAIRPHGLGA